MAIRNAMAMLVMVALATAGCGTAGKDTPANPGTGTTGHGVQLLQTSDDWGNDERAAFYSQDQGSQLIPLRWFLALQQPQGQKPFGADHLSRYGYLNNEFIPDSSLPVGFTKNGEVGNEFLGMTCAACHTRQIQVGKEVYRIDGGPAMVDFQSFLADLDAAVERTLQSPDVFAEFAREVLSSEDGEEPRAELRRQVEAWYTRFHTITSRSLPKNPWGPGRLDAVGMIFNRVTGLDIAGTADGMIPENILVADAPARYPFLWNAAIQDRTQWPGFAENGNDLLGLARNLGEVYGVFGHLHPQPADWSPLFGVDYITQNSANFEGLAELEHLIRKIPVPKYPGPIDAALAAEGEQVFHRPQKNGGCAECHQIVVQENLLGPTWKTPIQNVGTDTREFQLLSRKAKTGILEGYGLPTGAPLGPEEPAFQILRTVVVGAIVQAPFRDVAGKLDALLPENAPLREAVMPDAIRTKLDGLQRAFPSVDELQAQWAARTSAAANAPAIDAKYESRVMQGIWAAAPYLHNGSVPTLADLLEPVDKRPKEFEVGPEYDLKRVGLARKQSKFGFTLKTTDASDLGSGNSRAGHEFGTDLSASEKKALLEYLKSL
jgi:hypothetical protein